MGKRFETDHDLIRETKAITKFVNLFDGTFKKLDPNDIDYKVFDKEKKLIAYAEVKGRLKTLATAYPLPVAIRKLKKLSDKRLNPVMIWACDDGIIYGKVSELTGTIKWGGRIPREGAVNDAELMAYYDKQKPLKYVRYV
jgi:hypothetical protein